MPLVRVRFKASGPVLHRVLFDGETVTVPPGDAGVTFDLPVGRHFVAWFVRGAFPEIKYSILVNSGPTVITYRANVPLGEDRRSFDSAEFTVGETATDPVSATERAERFLGEEAGVVSLHDPVQDHPEDYATPPTDEEVSFISPDALPR